MKAKRLRRRCAAAVLAAGLLAGAAGCDQDAAAELATTSGAFLGDVVAILATRSLELAWGVEGEAAADEHAHEDEHSATPLHEHEH